MLHVDHSRAPLIVFTFENELGEVACRKFEKACEGYFERGEVAGYAIRTLNMKLPEIRHLKRMASWVRANEDNLAKLVPGHALCIEAPVIRGALKFINKVSPPPSPQAIFSTWDETVQWVQGRLQARGLNVPPAA